MRLIHVCSICKTEWEAEGVPTDKDVCPSCSPEFKEFKKIPRLSRDIVVTEKIDVNVNSTGILGIYGQNGANNRSQTANRRFLRRPAGVRDGKKGWF
jgi:hypothetical protein